MPARPRTEPTNQPDAVPATALQAELRALPVGCLEPDPSQPRHTRSDNKLAERVALYPVWVRQLAIYSSLQKLAPEVKEVVRARKITGRTALALKPLPMSEQVELLHRILAEKLTSDQVRLLAAEKQGRCMARHTESQSALQVASDLRLKLAEIGKSMPAAEQEELRELLREALAALD